MAFRKKAAAKQKQPQPVSGSSMEQKVTKAKPKPGVIRIEGQEPIDPNDTRVRRHDGREEAFFGCGFKGW